MNAFEKVIGPLRKFGPGILIPVLCVAIGIAGAALAPSCATVKSVTSDVVKSAANPDSAVGVIVADCAKPEIANQIANVLAGLNQIALDPSTAVQVKNDEIAKLEAGGKEVLACALRQGIADLTALVTSAAQAHAAVDGKIISARALYVDNVFSRGYSYTDGWAAYPGGNGGASGLGGSGGGGASGSPGGAGGSQ